MDARRLVLDAAELAVLADALALPLPPGLAAADAGEAARAAAAERLRGTELVGDGSLQPVTSLAVNLTVLARPVVAVRVEAGLPGKTSRAWYAMAGPFGASAFVLAAGRVELSFFAAEDFGRELLRAVPGPSAGSPVSVTSVLNPGAAPVPLTGTVSLDELRAPDRRWFSWLPPAGTGPAARARAEADGTLHALVTGRAVDGSVLAGQVVWLRTGDRWTGMRPRPGRTVRFEPVERDDFPAWLAPYLATVLEASHG